MKKARIRWRFGLIGARGEEAMKQWVMFLFGKPYEHSKLFMLFYWLAVGVYVFGSLINLYYGLASPSKGSLLSFLVPAVFFPLLFRIVYRVNVKVHQLLWGER